MARYNFESIKENNDFLDFINKEYGYENFDKIPLWEQKAIFYKFKARENDIDNDDFAYLEENKNNESLEAVSKEYYPDKKLSDLEMDDLAFVQAMAKDLNQPNSPTLEEIHAQRIRDGEYAFGVSRQHYTRDNLEQILKAHDLYMLTPEELEQNTELKNMTDEERANHTNLSVETIEQATQDIAEYANGDLTIDADAYDTMQKYIDVFGKEWQNGEYKLTPEAEKALKRLAKEKEDLQKTITLDDNQETFDIGVIPTPGADKEKQNSEENVEDPAPNNLSHSSNKTKEQASEVFRQRSPNSDSNEFMIDTLQLEVLRDMKIINDQIYNAGMKNPQSAIQTFHSVRELNDKEQKEFEGRLTEKMLADERLFDLVPPSFLADRYENLQQKLAEDKKNNTANPDTSKLEKVERRIDQLAVELYDNRGLYFNDVTNIADTYEGYMKMFDAREKYLDPQKQSDANYKKILDANRTKLNGFISKYDAEMNISGVDAKSAEALDKRFDEIKKGNESATLSEKTLALVSNFKFLDGNGTPESQFQSADKKTKSDVWQKGYEIIPDSKLSTVVEIAKNKVLMNNLGTQEKITPQYLNSELNDVLPGTLFAMHVADKVAHGSMEHPEELTDKKYLDSFVTDLSNVEKPMSISPKGYEAAIDSQVNEVAGFANRLGQKIGKDKPVVIKQIEQVSKFDKRAEDRTTNGKADKKKIRKEMRKRMVKRGVSAFLVSGAITTASTAMAADASLTAATGGLNKVAGVALGLGLGTVMIGRNFYKWRQERKKEGKKAGLLSFVKQPRMMSTVATTALGAAAIGFAVSGNPGLAQACGIGALTVGVGSGLILDTKDNKKAGLGTAESLAWALGSAGISIGAAFGGRATANAGIDWFNKAYPDNEIFQHKEFDHLKAEFIKETVIDYGALDDNAEKFLKNNWYKDHPDLLQSRIDALTNAGVEHPHHMLLAAHDSGMIAPDNMKMWDGTTSHGNHTVLTKVWAEQSSVSFDDVQSMKHLFNNDGSVNSEAIKAYGNIAPHVGEDNFVTRMDPRPVIRELYGDRESTYDRNGHMPTNEIHKMVVSPEDKMVRNEGDVLGMLGIFTAPIKTAKRLKDRIGSLADKIFKRQKKTPTPPIPTPTPTPQPRPEPKPRPEPQPEKTKDNSTKLLFDEYKIVYGIEPNTTEGKNAAWKAYCARVEEERKAGAPDKSMNDFLLARRATLDKVVEDNVPGETAVNESGTPIRSDYLKKRAHDDRGKAGVIMEARQNLMQSNLTSDNFRNKITLSHFTKFVSHFIKHDEVAADGSRNIALNPKLKDKYKKEGSKVAIVDLNQYLVEGKPLEECKEKVAGKDARQAMMTLQKNNEHS